MSYRPRWTRTKSQGDRVRRLRRTHDYDQRAGELARVGLDIDSPGVFLMGLHHADWPITDDAVYAAKMWNA